MYLGLNSIGFWTLVFGSKVIYVEINGLNKRGELFIKRFSQRLNKNEGLLTTTEETIKEINQIM